MIQQLKRPTQATVARQQAERRSPASTLASVVLHVVLLAVLWSALKVPRALELLFTQSTRIKDSAPEEHLTYVQIPSRGAGFPSSSASPGVRSGPRPPEVLAPRLVAPEAVPATLPPAPSSPARPTPEFPSGPQNGPVIGGKGALAGTQPSYRDSRVWGATDTPLATAPKTSEQRLDSAVTASVKHFQDSVVANSYVPNKFERGDWTVEHNGKKYGIDQQYIRLGKFSIPTPLLALLPFNRVQTNPIAAEEGKRQLAMRMDIMEHAQASLNEEEFRRAVKEIRERKEREKRGQPDPGGVSRKRAGRAVVAPSERPPGQ